MDDNELDRLFGINGGDDGSGADDSEHLQIEKSKDKKESVTPEAKQESASEKKEPSEEGPEKDAGKNEPVDKESEPEQTEGEGSEKESGDEGGNDAKADGEEGEDQKAGEEQGAKSDEEEDKPAEKPSAEHHKETKPKKKKPKVRITGFGIGVIVFFVIVITLIMLLLFLPAFRVRSVTIEGNIELTDEEVLNEVGLKYNAHLMSGVSGNLFDILSLNYGKTEERIRRENPYISDISISIKIPSEVRINVSERRKIAYVSTPDGYIALDRNGIVLELNSGKVKQKVSPIVYGVGIESARLGEKVVVRDENAYKNAIIVLGAILAADNATIGDNFNMFEHTTEVRIIPSGYIFLNIYTASGKPVQIKLNRTDKINDKMSKLLYLFNSNAFDQVTIKGTLDMTGDEFIFNANSESRANRNTGNDNDPNANADGTTDSNTNGDTNSNTNGDANGATNGAAGNGQAPE